MLPSRAYATPPLPLVSSGQKTAPEERAKLVLAVDRAAVNGFQLGSFTLLPVHNTADALTLIERAQPRIVAVDWDSRELDGDQVVRAARRLPQTSVLVAMAAPEQAPAAIKSGCHAVLLKPFTLNLLAARLGRLCRERIFWSGAMNGQDAGTHRTWPSTACPKCSAPGATSFEFSSYRRMWYACLACEAVWLGKRQE
jgi:CheY-like chemotaxis protein